MALGYRSSDAQILNRHPTYDTLAIYGPDFAPMFECKSTHFLFMSPDTIMIGDRIAIMHQYSRFVYNPPPPATPVGVDTLCVDVVDSLAFNQYELWFHHAPPRYSSYFPADGQIPFDTLLPAMPGYFDITVKVRRNGVLIDSVKQAFISYMVGAVRPDQPNVPMSSWLYQNYPNPFNPNTIVRYRVQTRSLVSITVYNLLGQLVKTLTNGYANAGEFSLAFNGEGLTSGVYFIHFRCGNYSQSRKFVILQ